MTDRRTIREILPYLAQLRSLNAREQESEPPSMNPRNDTERESLLSNTPTSRPKWLNSRKSVNGQR